MEMSRFCSSANALILNIATLAAIVVMPHTSDFMILFGIIPSSFLDYDNALSLASEI